MFYCQKKDTYIRIYEEIGLINSIGITEARVFDCAGAVFLKALSKTPKSIEELADEILCAFVDVDRATIINDATEFYDSLVEEKLLTKGNTYEETIKNNVGFEYSEVLPSKQVLEIQSVVKKEVNEGIPDTQDFLEEYYKKYPHITSFQIEITSKCNERCIHCYIPHDLKLYDIEPKLYYDVLDQCSKIGVSAITLSGGEPMTNRHFVEYLRAAKEHDFYVTVLSNLTLLNDEIINALTEGNTSSVQVSLYSMKSEVHDYITQLPGSFEKTKANILKLLEHNVPVHVSCPTMKANKDDYMDVMKWCHEHKIRSQTDYIMMAKFNRETDNLANRLSVEEAANVIKQISIEDQEYINRILENDFETKCSSLQNNPDRKICGIGVDTACMVANGNVYPCPGWQEMVLGNLYKNSLDDIWKNSEKLKWIRALRFKDLGNGKCVKCKDAAFCAPCLVRNANETKDGNPLKINEHFCAVAKANKKIILDWRKEHLQCKV